MVGFSTDLKTLRQRFDQVIARIDKRIKELVESNPDRKEHVTHLRTITGVGPVVSAALVNSLWQGASHALPGRCTLTKPNSILDDLQKA